MFQGPWESHAPGAVWAQVKEEQAPARHFRLEPRKGAWDGLNCVLPGFIYGEPQDVTLFENRVFMEAIKLK